MLDWKVLIAPLSVVYLRISLSSFSASHVSFTAFLHLNNLHLFLFCWALLSSSLPAQIPFASQSSSLSFSVPLSVFSVLYLFPFSRTLLPLASPSEGRLKGVIQPPRQLHITSCLRKLQSLSSSSVCLSSSSPVCPHSASPGSSEYTESVQADAACHCHTNYLCLIINGAT